MNSKRTVICVGNFELPDKNAAANRVVNNAKLMRSLGVETVFLGACRGEQFDGVKKRAFDTGFDMFEQAYPANAGQWARQIFDMKNLKTIVRQYPDTVAVLLYNTQLATVLAARRAFSGSGIRILYDCTEWNTATDGSFLKRAVKNADSYMIEKRLARYCDGLIVVSSRMAKQYAKKSPLLLPPLVDTQDPIWNQTPPQQEHFTFCYAGSPSDKDRMDLLIEAFAALPEKAALLRIVGLTEAEYMENGGRAVPSGVYFTGRLPHSEAVREILGCDCFIFLREPSRRNSAGFPTKFTEAFTCGVPIITTAVSDVPFYADGACTLLRDVSPEGVLGAMRNVLSVSAGPRALRSAFDYRNYTDACGLWLERTLCKGD